MLEADKEGAMAVVDSGVVRCTCGKFYGATVTREGIQFVDVTRMSDPQQEIGPHTCPDNRFRWHRDPRPDPRYLERVRPYTVRVVDGVTMYIADCP